MPPLQVGWIARIKVRVKCRMVIEVDNPPFRYGIVEKHLYRGAYPKPRNMEFLKTLNLKTLISMTPEPLQELSKDGLQNVEFIHIKVDKPKENIPISFSKVFQILSLITVEERLPLYLHCLDGATITSLVILGLRKLQGWSNVSYMAEACRFMRDGSLSSEESEFISKLNGEFEIPSSLPKWLWGGNLYFKKHTHFKIKMNGGVQQQPPPLIKQVTSGAFTESPTLDPVKSTFKLQQLQHEKDELRRIGLSNTCLLDESLEPCSSVQGLVNTNGQEAEEEEEENISRTLEALDLELSSSVQI